MEELKLVLDIIVAFIMLVTMVFGFRRGFIYTFVHTLGWIGALVGSFFAVPYVKKFLIDKTGVQEWLSQHLLNNLNGSAQGATRSMNSLPQLVSDGMSSAVESANEVLATNLTNLLITLLSFLLVFFAIKAVLFLITIGLSRKKNKGFTGFFDGLLGLIAGTLKGVILVFIFLALLLPVTNLISPTSTDFILSSLDASYFARTLYDSNFVVMIINDIFA